MKKHIMAFCLAALVTISGCSNSADNREIEQTHIQETNPATESESSGTTPPVEEIETIITTKDPELVNAGEKYGEIWNDTKDYAEAPEYSELTVTRLSKEELCNLSGCMDIRDNAFYVFEKAYRIGDAYYITVVRVHKSLNEDGEYVNIDPGDEQFIFADELPLSVITKKYLSMSRTQYVIRTDVNGELYLSDSREIRAGGEIEKNPFSKYFYRLEKAKDLAYNFSIEYGDIDADGSVEILLSELQNTYTSYYCYDISKSDVEFTYEYSWGEVYFDPSAKKVVAETLYDCSQNQSIVFGDYCRHANFSEPEVKIYYYFGETQITEEEYETGLSEYKSTLIPLDEFHNQNNIVMKSVSPKEITLAFALEISEAIYGK